MVSCRHGIVNNKARQSGINRRVHGFPTHLDAGTGQSFKPEYRPGPLFDEFE